jgi:putative intracellular protease/amidase
MNSNTLNGLRIAILASDGFEKSELLEPRKALDEAGADTDIVSPKEGTVRGWNGVITWPSLKTDIVNSGGKWLDQEVVVDKNLVTSRKPDDLPAFNRAIAKLFSSVRSSATV